MGNPLLNLATALGQTPQTASVGGGFAVKKRWDDGMPPAQDFADLTHSAPTSKIWSSRIRLKQRPNDLPTLSMISSGLSSTSSSSFQFWKLWLTGLHRAGNLWPSSSSRIWICMSRELRNYSVGGRDEPLVSI